MLATQPLRFTSTGTATSMGTGTGTSMGTATSTVTRTRSWSTRAALASVTCPTTPHATGTSVRSQWALAGTLIYLRSPVGSGKTALLLALCRKLRDEYNIGVVTNDIFTREDQEFLVRNAALQDQNRIRAVETGGCPHAAIREDISANMEVLETSITYT